MLELRIRRQMAPLDAFQAPVQNKLLFALRVLWKDFEILAQNVNQNVVRGFLVAKELKGVS